MSNKQWWLLTGVYFENGCQKDKEIGAYKDAEVALHVLAEKQHEYAKIYVGGIDESLVNQDYSDLLNS